MTDTQYTITDSDRTIRRWSAIGIAIVVLVLGWFLASELRRTQRLAEEAQEAADREALRAGLIVLSSPYASMMCDESGRIIESNLAAELLLGWDHADIIGQLSTVLVPEKYRDAHTDGMRRSAERMRDYEGNWMLLSREMRLSALHKSGDLIPVIVSVRVIKFDKEIQFIVGMRADKGVPPPIPEQEPLPLPDVPNGSVVLKRAIELSKRTPE